MGTIYVIQPVAIARAAAIMLVQTHIDIPAGPLRFGGVHVRWIGVSMRCVPTSWCSWGSSAVQGQMLSTGIWTRWHRKLVQYRINPIDCRIIVGVNVSPTDVSPEIRIRLLIARNYRLLY
jgi:hypothetical protein